MLKILVVEPNSNEHFLLKQVFQADRDYLNGQDIVVELDLCLDLSFANLQLKSQESYDAILYSLKNSVVTDDDFKNIKSIFKRKPVLVLADSSTPTDAQRFLSLGAADYLVFGHYPGSLIKKSILNSIEKQRFVDRIEDLESRVENLKSRNDIVSKFAALGEITANIAHEINTPLSTILINVEYIQSDLKEDSYDKENVDKMLSVISRTCFRIAEIVKTLRDFARRKDGDPPAYISIDRVIDDALELFNVKTKASRVRVEFIRPRENISDVKGNFVELFLVIINLLNNAFDAVWNQNNPWIKIDLTQVSEFVCVAVTDSGFGITTELQKQIFEPFFTTKIGQGIGLGLNICEKIIRRHGGQFFLDKNHPNTRFVIELPTLTEKELT